MVSVKLLNRLFGIATSKGRKEESLSALRAEVGEVLLTLNTITSHKQNYHKVGCCKDSVLLPPLVPLVTVGERCSGSDDLSNSRVIYQNEQRIE